MGKEIRMLFNGEMVRAVLNGSKTQTRRIVKPSQNDFSLVYYKHPYYGFSGQNWVTCPYSVGDKIYMGETWKPFKPIGEDCTRGILYKAND